MKPEKAKLDQLGPDCASGCRLKTKFEVWGEEMIEKKVSISGKSGRVYVPLEWLGKSVKVIRVH